MYAFESIAKARICIACRHCGDIGEGGGDGEGDGSGGGEGSNFFGAGISLTGGGGGFTIFVVVSFRSSIFLYTKVVVLLNLTLVNL